jgi:hypothetical protein
VGIIMQYFAFEVMHDRLTTRGYSETAAPPDMNEPSLGNPNHRQFFHSVTVLGLLGMVHYISTV